MNEFLSEILEQPEALINTLKYYTDFEGKEVLIKIKNIFEKNKFEQIIFTGMGSSYFISYSAANLFNKFGLKSFVVNSSELLHYNIGLLSEKTLLICFSQSGESFEIKEILKIIPQDVYCIGITNEANSSLAKKSNIALLSKAGKEDMTSTKTFITTSLVSFILAWYLSSNWESDRIKSIENLADKIEDVLNNYKQWIDEVHEFLGELPFLQIIARGPSYSTAMQSALMYKEATRTAASGTLGGEFRHGPMEMVQKGFKSVLFAPEGKTIKQSIQMAKDIANFGGKVLLITNIDTDISNEKIKILKIDEQDEYLFSILSIIPVQLLVDYLGKSLGLEAGSFSRGAKVTVIE